jgi:hypothetical protein
VPLGAGVAVAVAALAGLARAAQDNARSAKEFAELAGDRLRLTGKRARAAPLGRGVVLSSAGNAVLTRPGPKCTTSVELAGTQAL